MNTFLQSKAIDIFVYVQSVKCRYMYMPDSNPAENQKKIGRLCDM